MALTFKDLEELQRQRENNIYGNSQNNIIKRTDGALTFADINAIQQNKNETVAPLAPITLQPKVQFIQQGLFADGYQAGDVTKTILGSVGDLGLNVLAGVGNFAEGIGDAINYGISDVADLFGADEFAEGLRKETQKSLVDELLGDTIETVDKWSILGSTTDSIAQGVGTMLPIFATGGVLGGLGATTGAISAVTTGMVGLSGYGSGVSEAYQGGATDSEARIYGAIAGASDALTESLFGGLGKSFNAIGFGRGLSSADDMFAKKVSSMFSNQF